MKTLRLPAMLAFMLILTGCGSSLVIQNVNYSQPLESVLSPDSDGVVHDQRYAIQFNIMPILEHEGSEGVDEIRLIRNVSGFYFITADGFNNVYIFAPGEGELSLHEEVELPNGPISEPAFNQRNSHIELINQSSGQSYNLDQNGIR
jgi:hypothetical protein